MRIYDSLVDLIGGTPLVRLTRVTRDVAPTVLAKAEFMNPGGSVKDRIAVRMVEAAERAGRLGPGGTIVEPTSGNTGVGLALVAQRRGYRCVFTCPDKVSADRVNVLRAYGARVEICPASAPPDHPAFYRNAAARLAAEIPGGTLLDQYSNQGNPLSHYLGTGPEIWRDTDGQVTHLVAGLGTGGTLSGAGRYLKEASEGRVRVIGADPSGSVYSAGTGRPNLLEGVGQPSYPRAFDPAVADEIIAVSDRDSIAMTRRLASEEALLAGGSSGMAVAAALAVASGLDENALIVAILPDSGRGYLSKIFNDDWLAPLGLLEPTAPAPWARDVLARSPDATAPLLVSPAETVGHAAKIVMCSGVRHLIVTAAKPPVRAAEVLGAVTDAALAGALARRPLDRAVGEAAEPTVAELAEPLPFVGSTQPLTEALGAASAAGGALVIDGGIVRGVVTPAQILALLAAPAAADGHAIPGGGRS